MHDEGRSTDGRNAPVPESIHGHVAFELKDLRPAVVPVCSAEPVLFQADVDYSVSIANHYGSQSITGAQ